MQQAHDGEDYTLDVEAEEERRDWLALSLMGLQGAYGEDEPEYPLTALKWVNPDYFPPSATKGC